MEIQIEAGKNYKLKHPHTVGLSKTHIDYILDNPVDGENELAYKLIVYRQWSRRRQCWYNHCDPYYVLAIYNDWKYK